MSEIIIPGNQKMSADARMALWRKIQKFKTDHQGRFTLLKLTEAEFVLLFHPSKQDAIRALMQKPGISAVVAFACVNQKSMWHGMKAAVCVGPREVVKTVQECEGKFMGEPALGNEMLAMYYCSKT